MEGSCFLAKAVHSLAKNTKYELLNYNQSQKKRTLNSLAPLWPRRCISFGQECMVLNPWIFFSFGSIPSNVLKMISYQNINWLWKANQILKTLSGENCHKFRISRFSWLTLKHFKTDGDEFWNGSFAGYHREHCQADVWTQLCSNRLSEKRTSIFQLSHGLNFRYFYMYLMLKKFVTLPTISFYNMNAMGIGQVIICTQTSEYCKVNLSTLFSKINTTFHGAFLLRLSVKCYVLNHSKKRDAFKSMWLGSLVPFTSYLYSILVIVKHSQNIC